MTPQATVFLAKANDLLAQAKVMLNVELAEAAGRTAYLSGFHAAQAFIFENRPHREDPLGGAIPNTRD